ncbi:ferredoxin--NADP reductase [Myroides pelagicus]|uniref:2Fe-2S iron-sulfur cluster binding domain-containing protein n=1 Tax=Myroides pelagicus TaxID=270914 RepID=A0A7K1GKK2_9FLAO|nr:ferredoxin--NADP reductase [Myroides pelagicus]MEC4113230.1 ferredoxin--NADP reductase [Myroides pelagicus]MTH29397.1 2Fe-2S iron-sulfur cluster binding domain-containing protein [Myroides pelagicus]
MSKFNRLTVKEVRKETPNAVSIVFDIPSNLKDEYQFKAGQYLNIKHLHEGKEIRRAYSICSTPNSGEVRVAVKKVEHGVFSTYANDVLKAGDQLEVEAPEGRFIFEPKTDNVKNYAAFAAGSGITPIMSILKSVLEQEPNSQFVLVYGNKNAEETIFHDELYKLQEQYAERLFIHFVYSRIRENDSIFGRIDKAAINFVVNNKHKEKEFAKFYICGPEEMINTVNDTLQERGVSKDHIAYEIFTPNTDGVNPVEAEGGSTKVTVLVDDEETSFEMPKSEVLLNGVLKEGIDAPYSCQGGICSSCMCKIVKGSAIMKKNSILTDEEIADGLILSCQAIVTSDEIYIDYDDM